MGRGNQVTPTKLIYCIPQISPKVFDVFAILSQVGDGDTDHYCWQRPEDMTTSRQAYKIDQNNPGSDLAGETAAAMAAAALVFKKTNPHYAHLLLHHAQQVAAALALVLIQFD